MTAERSTEQIPVECDHPGRHTSPPNACPDCGRFSADSWHDGAYSTPNGWYEAWGGMCGVHGEWSDSA